MLTKCPSCKGAKKMIKLGGMEGDCNKCSGAGYVSKEEEVKTEPVEPVSTKSKSKKG